MRLNNFLLLMIALLGFTLTSCEEDEATQLEKKVIEVHDVVMPHMVDMGRLSDSLSMLVGESTTLDSLQIVEVQRGIEMLEEADDKMNVWMKEFETKSGDIEYLNEEMKKIKRVGVDTNKAMKNAREILTKYAE